MRFGGRSEVRNQFQFIVLVRGGEKGLERLRWRTGRDRVCCQHAALHHRGDDKAFKYAHPDNQTASVFLQSNNSVNKLLQFGFKYKSFLRAPFRINAFPTFRTSSATGESFPAAKTAQGVLGTPAFEVIHQGAAVRGRAWGGRG